MYASLFTCRVRAGHLDELRRLLEGLIPEAERFPGLQRGYLLTEPGADRVALVGLYATEAEARGAGSGDRFARLQGAVSHTLVPGSVERRVYEVASVLEGG